MTSESELVTTNIQSEERIAYGIENIAQLWHNCELEELHHSMPPSISSE